MAVVRINAIEVPEGMGERIEMMFSKRLGAVDKEPGFLGFELLRPTGENERRYFVVTHWESAQDFENWVNSENFQHGHRGTGGPEQQHSAPVSTGAELLSFDVVLSSTPGQ
ncbi:MAG: antibiotic biosynthesis monooxygenase [Acidimicrobiales bacterium]|nr:antibiotic biosynthesis monooxygenase [Acidimicrobiales bacterium]